jgi:hypothetical protein
MVNLEISVSEFFLSFPVSYNFFVSLSFSFSCSLEGPGILVPSGVILLYISAGLSIWSLAVYVSKIWKVLLK